METSPFAQWLPGHTQRMVGMTSLVDMQIIMDRMKQSRKLALLRPDRKRHAVVLRECGEVLLATGWLLGAMRAAGIEDGVVSVVREQWQEWILRRPWEVARVTMGLMGASADLRSVGELAPADVKRAQIRRWREKNLLKSV